LVLPIAQPHRQYESETTWRETRFLPSVMAVVRTLVDGNGLLDRWPTLAPGKSRTSEVAREELFAQLTQYHDNSGIPITLIFVGPDTGPITSTYGVEVVYAPTVKAALSLMLRAISRNHGHGETNAVTDNPADQTKLKTAGGLVCTSANFIQEIQNAHSEFERNLSRYNQNELIKFTTVGRP
jgi:predicted RNA-binding protein with PIN domain